MDTKRFTLIPLVAIIQRMETVLYTPIQREPVTPRMVFLLFTSIQQVWQTLQSESYGPRRPIPRRLVLPAGSGRNYVAGASQPTGRPAASGEVFYREICG